MLVKNKSNNTIICERAGYADSFSSRFRGLMLSRRHNLVMKTKSESVLDATIHMMFMLYPIHVIWLDKDMRVVDVQRDVPRTSLFKPKTWRMYKPKKPANYIIELVDDFTADVGDELEFEFGSPSKNID